MNIDNLKCLKLFRTKKICVEDPLIPCTNDNVCPDSNKCIKNILAYDIGVCIPFHGGSEINTMSSFHITSDLETEAGMQYTDTI